MEGSQAVSTGAARQIGRGRAAHAMRYAHAPAIAPFALLTLAVRGRKPWALVTPTDKTSADIEGRPAQPCG